MRKCTKCKNEKDLGCFVKNKNTHDGFHLWCKTCLSEGKKQSYLKNKAHYNAKSRANYHENRERYNEMSREWRQQNPERLKELVAKYRASAKGKETRRQENKRRYDSGYRKAWNFIRRRGIERATPQWVDKKQLQEFFKNRPKGFHVDHIVPLRGKIVSGLNVPWNLQYLPAHENFRKSNKFSE